jgi:hypothetical protein
MNAEDEKSPLGWFSWTFRPFGSTRQEELRRAQGEQLTSDVGDQAQVAVI